MSVDPASTTDDEFRSLILDDPVMKRYAIAFARRVPRDRRGFALGLYAEAIVADALGVDLAPGGTDRADLLWHPDGTRLVTLQVRSCNLTRGPGRAAGSFSVGKPRNRRQPGSRAQLGELWVFAAFNGDNYRTDWRFCVLRADYLDNALGDRKTCVANRLAPASKWITAHDLPRTCAAAASPQH